MNKFTLALALGTGLTLSLTAPHAHADTIQTLPSRDISASTFSSMFQPIGTAPAMMSSFQFNGAPVSGVMESQVFQGTGAAAGLYAYAYQVGVNNVTDSTGNTVNVQGASWKFNATPVGTDFFNPGQTDPGTKAYLYTVTSGQVGNLNLPQAAPGQMILSPTSVNWAQNEKVGSLVASFVNPSSNVSALGGGGNSATFVVITDKMPTQQFVNVLSPNPIDLKSNLTSVYSPESGNIKLVPIPEPTTVLAWAGVAGGLLLIRRLRKGRGPVAV